MFSDELYYLVDLLDVKIALHDEGIIMADVFWKELGEGAFKSRVKINSAFNNKVPDSVTGSNI